MTEYREKVKLSLQELYKFFYARLCEISDALYSSLLSAGVINRDEVDNEVRQYYEKKRSGLQEVYSYYSQQWDAYNSLSQRNGREFVNELSRLLPAFSRHYKPAEFNVIYYYELLSATSVDSSRWSEIRLQFMERWSKVLYNKEIIYQNNHIESLCSDYYRIVKTSVSNLENKSRYGTDMARRLGWLQNAQTPEMKTKIKQLANVIINDKMISEIVEYLGRSEPEVKKIYKAEFGNEVKSTFRHASPSDIEGVSVGCSLNSLLPSEYCYMSDSLLYPFFLRKYTQKKLQIFNTYSYEHTPVSRNDAALSKFHFPETKGPFVVCVDTSGSMAGEKELLAKAITLAVVMHAESRGRMCKIMLFSDKTDTIEIVNAYNDIHLLEDFLIPSFHGGTDFACAIREAVLQLSASDYKYADMLWISDFDMNPVDSDILSSIIKLKTKDVRFSTVVLSATPELSFLKYADKVWMRL